VSQRTATLLTGRSSTCHATLDTTTQNGSVTSRAIAYSGPAQPDPSKVSLNTYSSKTKYQLAVSIDGGLSSLTVVPDEVVVECSCY